MNKGGIMGVVFFTSTADWKQSDGTHAEIVFIGELIYQSFINITVL